MWHAQFCCVFCWHGHDCVSKCASTASPGHLHRRPLAPQECARERGEKKRQENVPTYATTA